MSEGTAEKQQRLGAVDAHGVSHLTVQEKSLAHVVQQHKQDNQTPKGINGQQALS